MVRAVHQSVSEKSFLSDLFHTHDQLAHGRIFSKSLGKAACSCRYSSFKKLEFPDGPVPIRCPWLWRIFRDVRIPESGNRQKRKVSGFFIQSCRQGQAAFLKGLVSFVFYQRCQKHAFHEMYP